MNARAVLFATFVAISLSPATAQAETCTVYGTVSINSWDSYYCDESVPGIDCTGWLEQNLDSSTKPMKNMHVWVESYPSGVVLGHDLTSLSGYYSISWGTAGNCSAVQFKVRYVFMSADPADQAYPFTGRNVSTRLRQWS